MAVATTKGNDGQSPYARQRRMVRVIVWLLLLLAAYHVMVSHFLRGFVPDIEIDPETGRKRVRRRPERNKKIGPDGKVTNRSPVDGIIEGHFHLIDIVVPDFDVLSQKRYNIQGIFCALEWHRQQQDPSSVPVFDDLITKSTLCRTTQQTVDLFDISQQARKWDLHMRNTTYFQRLQKREQAMHLPAPEAEPIERSIPPTALIFHESRCGSTLVSNVLASFAPDGSSRVYSEAAPLLKALEACGNDAKLCNSKIHQKLIRDVFYLMGRIQLRGPSHNYVFYKIQSKAVHYMSRIKGALREEMPPWMYLYRDNVHVMQSHFKGSAVMPASEERNVLGQKKAPKLCLEGYGPPQQPGQPEPPQALRTMVVENMGRTIESLSQEEYCAAYLASLSESAIQQYDELGETQQSPHHKPHFFINYNQLPDIIWDHVLPALDVPLKAQDIHRMEKVAAMYTQGRGKDATKQVFKGDSQHKEQNVPFKISQAAHDFMDPTFIKLEALSKKTTPASSIVTKKEDEDGRRRLYGYSEATYDSDDEGLRRNTSKESLSVSRSERPPVVQT